MQFKSDDEAIDVLRNPPDDNFQWIAAIDHLLNHASGETRAKMMNKFESMPKGKQEEIRRMLDIYNATQAMSPS